MMKCGAMKLDSFDRKILAAVQHNNLQPHRMIAAHVALSAPAVARRLQRLRDEGAIRADVSLVDAAAVGRPMRVIVEVCVDSELPDKLHEAKARFVGCAQVQHCYYTSGEVDFVLLLAVRDMAEYVQLTDTLFVATNNVRSFRSFFALQTVKESTAVAIDEP
jgi:Lrp/AsnC family transcriptional regulator, leucine-responsive regulatory protein